ncbi:MAG: phage tail protein [Flavobacteriia bacterium]|nr:phage tail protein [Flavobacteriia bacterium]MBH2023905.1 phage tail protein [Flavobacteriales bacterium]
MRKLNLLLLLGLLSGSLKLAAQENFIGQIMIVPYNFSPVGWHDCDGAMMPIAEYEALYSLIGTTYGGDGVTTFGLPDARGRVVVDDGTGPGFSTMTLGQIGGVENATVITTQLPSHGHIVNAVNTAGTKETPAAFLPADAGVLDKDYSSLAPNTTMAPGMISPAGSGQAHNNIQPFVTLKCVIALYGMYPQQN